ncbi:MAG: hypothetical protein K0S05_596 [Agromyces sp.]|nr:hypothetical protein [Agromyces sp.]
MAFWLIPHACPTRVMMLAADSQAEPVYAAQLPLSAGLDGVAAA